MELNEQLQRKRDESPLVPREEKLQETLAKAREVWFRSEQDRLLTYGEFLWTQLQYTRKRWWGLQAALLLFACLTLPALEVHFLRIRSAGVIGCLFVVFMIPELWRNRECDAVQVEAACYYSLRQMYAARITLFGVVDVTLLTLFGVGLGRMGFGFVDVISQFLLPVTVTACICFSMLCGKQNWNELVSLGACFAWCGAWWLILMNERIYFRIVPAVWVALFGLALALLGMLIRKTLRTTNQYWEVEFA